MEKTLLKVKVNWNFWEKDLSAPKNCTVVTNPPELQMNRNVSLNQNPRHADLNTKANVYNLANGFSKQRYSSI